MQRWPLGSRRLNEYSGARMNSARVCRLTLNNFRSYRSLAFASDAPLIVLVGPNGAGKTNVLEAVSLFSPGRGLRGANLADMARQGGAGGFAVAARLGEVE